MEGLVVILGMALVLVALCIGFFIALFEHPAETLLGVFGFGVLLIVLGLGVLT